MSWLKTLGNLKELVEAIEMDLLDIRETLDMHQFCAYWGAYDIFSYLKDAICLLHGNVGCMANRRFMPVLGSFEACDFDPHYTTGFTEHEVIFGGEKKLATAIAEINAKHQPKLLAVVTNCCADIIGDDVAGIANAARATDPNVVWLHTGGFTGKSYRQGSEQALNVLAQIMEDAPAQPVKKGSVNIFLRRWIFGETQQREAAEAIRLMEKMGLTVNQVMRKGMTFDEFISLKTAEANVAMCFYFGMALFEEMKTRFGTKMVKATTPIGLTQTLVWMNELREIMALDYDPAQDDEIRALTELRERVRNRIGPNRYALVWAQTGERMIGMTRLAIDVGLQPIVVGVDSAIVRDKIKIFRKEIDEGFDPKISTAQTVEDIRELARVIGNPVIFCNDDFFPEYPVFKYRFAQSQVYGLAGCRLVYQKLLDAFDARRSRYSLTAQVVPT